ncbi:GGDEF domain-containing protein, partial [Parasulfuritortus cantonensis]|uniref:GGDEF domain-containing protein n=1 Tax=Parasulfuritortus cantonensis TaxID=2528202 RepID=UPI00140462CF
LLLLVVTTALAVFYRVRYLQRELDQRATRDFLTGMPNRRHFMELAEREFVRAARHGTPLALAVVDLDLFKNINDTYGHEVGDQVLKRFCAVTRQALRHLDTLGRVGGEEFAILLPDTRLAAAREVAERVRQAVEAADLTTARGERVAFTGSFGLTAYLPGDTDLTALFRRADVALYEAKAGGRNAVRVQAD